MTARLSICLNLWLLIPATSFSQIERGTSIVYRKTKEALVLAADSRSVTTLGDKIQKISDETCKITKVSSNGIFAESGLSAGGPIAGSWTAAAEAREVVMRYKLNTPEQMRDAANAWGKFMADRIYEVVKANPRSSGEQLNVVLGPTSGTFAAYMPHIGIVMGRVDLHVTGHRQVQTHYDVVGGRWWETTGVGRFVSSEIREQTTDRSHQYQYLLPLLKSEHSEDMKTSTIELTKVAELWYPDVVNGPIDQVMLNRSGVYWLRRKPGCAAN